MVRRLLTTVALVLCAVAPSGVQAVSLTTVSGVVATSGTPQGVNPDVFVTACRADGGVGLVQPRLCIDAVVSQADPDGRFSMRLKDGTWSVAAKFGTDRGGLGTAVPVTVTAGSGDVLGLSLSVAYAQGTMPDPQFAPEVFTIAGTASISGTGVAGGFFYVSICPTSGGSTPVSGALLGGCTPMKVPVLQGGEWEARVGNGTWAVWPSYKQTDGAPAIYGAPVTVSVTDVAVSGVDLSLQYDDVVPAWSNAVSGRVVVSGASGPTLAYVVACLVADTVTQAPPSLPEGCAEMYMPALPDGSFRLGLAPGTWLLAAGWSGPERKGPVATGVPFLVVLAQSPVTNVNVTVARPFSPWQPAVVKQPETPTSVFVNIYVSGRTDQSPIETSVVACQLPDTATTAPGQMPYPCPLVWKRSGGASPVRVDLPPGKWAIASAFARPGSMGPGLIGPPVFLSVGSNGGSASLTATVTYQNPPPTSLRTITGDVSAFGVPGGSGAVLKVAACPLPTEANAARIDPLDCYPVVGGVSSGAFSLQLPDGKWAVAAYLMLPGETAPHSIGLPRLVNVNANVTGLHLGVEW